MQATQQKVCIFLSFSPTSVITSLFHFKCRKYDTVQLQSGLSLTCVYVSGTNYDHFSAFSRVKEHRVRDTHRWISRSTMSGIRKKANHLAVFKRRSKNEDNAELSRSVILGARKTGRLNLSSKGLSTGIYLRASPVHIKL